MQHIKNLAIKITLFIIVSILVIIVSNYLISMHVKPRLEVVIIVHDVVPVNISEWPIETIYSNWHRLDSTAKKYHANISLAIIPYTIENYGLDEVFISELKKYCIVQHGYRHTSMRPPIKETDSWHEFVDADYGPLTYETQSKLIIEGKKVIERKLGVKARIFIAPQYRYDNVTLVALSDNGLTNFDPRKTEFVDDYDPWTDIADSDNITINKSLKLAQISANSKKPLIIEVHLQTYSSIGDAYMHDLLNELEEEYEVHFVTLDCLMGSC